MAADDVCASTDLKRQRFYSYRIVQSDGNEQLWLSDAHLTAASTAQL